MIGHKVAYLCVIALMWALKVLFTFRITTVLFYIVLIIPVCLFVMLCWQGGHVKLGLSGRNQIVEKGCPFNIAIKVSNTSKMTVYRGIVRIKYRGCGLKKWKKVKLRFTAPPGESLVQLQLQSDYSAYMEFILVSATIYDMLGLFRWRKWKKRTQQERLISVNILPKLHEIVDEPIRRNPSVMVEGDQFSDQHSGDDPAQVFDVREYMDGDKLNRVHWKMTAKTDELMVKEFGEPIDSAVLILLDLSAAKKKSEQLRLRDALMETALSLSQRLLQERQTHLLAWNTETQERITRLQIQSEEDFYMAAGLLLRTNFKPVRGLPFRRFMRKGSTEMRLAAKLPTPEYYMAEYEKEQYTSIFYISGADTLERDAIQLMENRKSAWLHIISVGAAKPELSERYQVPGVYPAHVSIEQLGTDISNLSFWEGGVGGETK